MRCGWSPTAASSRSTATSTTTATGCSPGAGDPRTPCDAGAAGNRKAQKRAEAEARQREYAQKKPLVDRQTKLEREMDALDAERKAVEDWLASPAAYADADKEALKERIARQGDLAWQLARLETEWLEVSEALENLRSTA